MIKNRPMLGKGSINPQTIARQQFAHMSHNRGAVRSGVSSAVHTVVM